MQQFLRDIIVRAGELTLEYRRKAEELQVDCKSEKDLVTEADRAVEDFLRGEINAKYPDHAILGEEGGQKGGGSYRWIIDPIDGTTAFVHGQPFYSVSIGVEKDGQMVLGAVNAPVLGDLFEAALGFGATCNGRPIGISKRAKLVQSVVCTGFACLRSNWKKNNLPYFCAVAPVARGVRRYGSAAVDLCYVGCGRLEAFWEMNLKIYDVAAGLLIAAEAGAKISDFQGRAWQGENLLVSNGLIHEEMVEIFRRVDEENKDILG